MTIKLYEKDQFFIRPFIIADITKSYLQWFHDQEVTKYTSHGLFKYTKEQAIEFLENADRNNDVIWAIIIKGLEFKVVSSYPGTKNYWDIVTSGYKEKGSDIHVGNIALQNINWINRTAEFAGIIGEKKYWGKGIGTEAIRLLFAHGFDKLNLNKIYLGTAEHNKGMITIALKLGMKQEGILKNHVFLNGDYCNIYQFGIMRDKWHQKS